MRLLLVRHGQTQANVDGVLDSAPPGPPLTDLGHEQAATLADALRDFPVVAVHASIATRAQQTAAPIAAAHGLSVEVTDGLHEVFVGEAEGSADPVHVSRFITVCKAWQRGGLGEPMPGGETGHELLDRYVPVLSSLRDRHPEGDVVVVSHSAAIRIVACVLAANVTPEFAEEHYVRNCSVVTLEPTDSDGWRCLDWAGAVPA